MWPAVANWKWKSKLTVFQKSVNVIKQCLKSNIYILTMPNWVIVITKLELLDSLQVHPATPIICYNMDLWEHTNGCYWTTLPHKFDQLSEIAKSAHEAMQWMKIIKDLYLNAMKASPCSPPTMWTPPSGIDSPRKNCRISAEFADHGRFWSLMITLIVLENKATPRCHPVSADLMCTDAPRWQ